MEKENVAVAEKQEVVTNAGVEVVKDGKKVITYKCDECHVAFDSRKVREGDKLCKDCIEIRRALKGFIKRGLTAETIVKRGAHMLGVKLEAKGK